MGLLTELFGPDQLSGATPTEQSADLSSIQNQTGWDRVKRMFTFDEYGGLSKELVTISHVGGMSLFIGAIYGGVIHSRVAYMNFVENNQATKFNDHMEAKKRLQDAVTKSFGRGAWRWAWRLTLFSCSFVGISTTISVYRGKSGILEFVGAGFVSGALYKLNLGPRGWIVGGGVGSVLGLIAGGATLGLLKISGMSMEDVRYWQYEWQNKRTERINKNMTAYLENEEHEAIRYHNQKLGEAGKHLENLDKA